MVKRSDTTVARLNNVKKNNREGKKSERRRKNGREREDRGTRSKLTKWALEQGKMKTLMEKPTPNRKA